jgi:hypothetical protein
MAGLQTSPFNPIEEFKEEYRCIEARFVSAIRRRVRAFRCCDKIALAVGAVINHYKMAKHFDIAITDHDFAFERKTAAIDAEALLDGIYVLRTDLKPATLDASATVSAYKKLANVESNVIVHCVVHDSGREGIMWLSAAMVEGASPR